MRLFLLGVLCLTVTACRSGSENDPSTGALRVLVFYSTFRPGCLTLTAEDTTAAGRSTTAQVTVDATRQSDTRTVAVFRQADWSRDLRLVARAYERTCTGPLVAEQTVLAQVPEEGRADVEMNLRAEDLDDDGFVSTANGGTDCDDAVAEVNPQATEVCDGIDNNCANGEAEAAGSQTWYVDQDSDGYGTTPFPACGQPAGAAAQGGDCNDNDVSIHPGQDEVLCDGVDENCDNVADDTFGVGQSCTAAFNCPGTNTCKGDESGAECVSTQLPVAWYVDEDGDGKPGADGGMSCVSPAPGAAQTSADCDESSRFVAGGLTEVCDRLDNDCDGQVDNTDCASAAWVADAGVGGATTRWNAVAVYAPGKAWLAGDENTLAHVDGDTVTEFGDCTGTWNAAWASSTGRVFLAGNSGKVATRTPTEACATVNAIVSAPSVNGITGFEGPGGALTVFAVAGDGRIVRWNYPDPPTVVDQRAANLRDVHGTTGPETMLAVGALDYEVPQPEPRAFRYNPDGGAWLSEDAGAVGTGFLRGVHVVDARRAYAVGDNGLALERFSGAWRELPRLTDDGGVPLNALGVVAYGQSAVYAVSPAKAVHFFDGGTWGTAYEGTQVLRAIDGPSPTEIWATGQNGALVRWKP